MHRSCWSWKSTTLFKSCRFKKAELVRTGLTFFPEGDVLRVRASLWGTKVLGVGFASPSGKPSTCAPVHVRATPKVLGVVFASPSGCAYAQHVPFGEEGEPSTCTSSPKGCAYAQHVPFGEEGVARTRAPSVRARFVRAHVHRRFARQMPLLSPWLSLRDKTNFFTGYLWTCPVFRTQIYTNLYDKTLVF